eukprot:COSAG06_NODE_2655_length_6487_cov_123.824515_4_plen_108_part_00
MEYEVSASQCATGCFTGRRRKAISVKKSADRSAKVRTGRHLRLPPCSPEPTRQTTWVVQEGWVLRESKPQGDPTIVSLFNDGHSCVPNRMLSGAILATQAAVAVISQ